MTLAKATIKSEEAGVTIECKFNPTQYTYTKKPGWAMSAPHAKSLAVMTFHSIPPAVLKLQVFLDGTEDAASQKDLKKSIGDLLKLVTVDKSRTDANNKQGRPPTCIFSWGSFFSFEAAITSLLLTYTLFLDDGTPVRATADVEFTQLEDKNAFPGTNPTSGGVTGERIHRLGPRETLELVAWSEFGDTSLWRPLAAFNDIDDPLRVRAGDSILLPASGDDLKAFG
jgi:hypothetical protein